MTAASFHLDQLEFTVERWENETRVELLGAFQDAIVDVM